MHRHSAQAITGICWCASFENIPALGCSGYEHRPGLRHQRGIVPSGSRAGHTPHTPARMHVRGSNSYIRLRIHNHTDFRIRVSTHSIWGRLGALWYTVANVGMGIHVSVLTHTLCCSGPALMPLILGGKSSFSHLKRLGEEAWITNHFVY